jgi:hypothetical protein
MKRELSFAAACSKYVHRFTTEHIPSWSKQQMENGNHYAPQYASDREWYDNTYFPGESGHIMGKLHGGQCDSRNATFPLGKFLSMPFKGN